MCQLFFYMQQPAPLRAPHLIATTTTSNNTMSTTEERQPSVKLVTSDNEEFEVEREVATKSVLIKNMIEGTFSLQAPGSCLKHATHDRSTFLYRYRGG